MFSFSRDRSRCGIKSCNPKNQIWDKSRNQWYLSHSGCGIKSGIHTTFLARNCGSTVRLGSRRIHAESRQTRIGQVAPRRVSAAHLGWVRAAALPRGGPCPPGGHCAALDGPTRLRSPSTRSPRSGAPRAPRGATSRRCGGRPASRAGRQPERRRCGGRGRGRGRQPRGRRLLRALRAGANWPPPNSHPSTHGRDAPGDAIDRGHMEMKSTVQSRVRICLIYKSLFLCA